MPTKISSAIDVTSSLHKDIRVTRVGMDSVSFRVVLGYAPQETDDPETRENFFTELEIELADCKVNGDIPILVGDLNAKIEFIDNKIIPTSSNGKFLAGIIENQQLNVLNFDQKCSGKWTHVIRTTGQSSVLDYVMIGSEACIYVKDIIIDEHCVFCPFAIKKNKTQYSDHNAIVTTMEVQYSKKKQETPISWKTKMSDLI